MAAAVESGAQVTDTQVDLNTIPLSPPGKEGEGEEFDKSVQDPNAEVTVFHDKENFNVKHPLMHKWTLWFTKPPTGKQDWNELLKKVVTFDSVEEFWGIYNNIAPTSDLAVKSDYHLFKEGVRPEWEDPQNKHGGRWSYSFYKKDKGSNLPIDDLWLWTMLAAIGETLEGEGEDEVMGVVVNVRKGFYRIGVWTKTMGRGGGRGAKGSQQDTDKNRQVLMDVGRRFKEVLKLEESESVEFAGHTDSASSGSTRAKPKLVV